MSQFENIGTEKCLRMYKGFVTSVENGYTQCISEYTNDLNSRDILEERWEDAQVLSNEQKIIIADLDARLKRLLKPTLRPIWQIDPVQWWHKGLPYNAGDELKQDAVSLNYWEG